MSGIEFDASAIREFAVDLGRVSLSVAREIPAVVSKGALNVKTQLQEEMRSGGGGAGRSERGGIAATIAYDILDGGFEAEIGPSAEGGSVGNLANINYFGGAHGGGGTVADPRGALDAELPKFEKALLDVAEKAFK